MADLKPNENRGAKVLLVSSDLAIKQVVGEWLSEEGHEVIECPGPRPPDFTCLGGRNAECPLAKAAEVVVLDLDLRSDSILMGTPSWRLLDYYIGCGHPVVAICGLEEMDRLFLDERVTALERPVDRAELLRALERSTARRTSVPEIGAFRLTPRRRAHRPLGKQAQGSILEIANAKKGDWK